MRFDPVVAVKHYHAVLEARDLVAVEACFAEHARYQSLGLGDLQGRATIMAALHLYFTDNPQHTSQDEAVKATSDRSVESLWTLTTGPNLSRRGRESISFDQFGAITSIKVEDVDA